IGDFAFYECSNLREVVLNEGLQKIGQWAFCECKLMESIDFSSTVSEVGERAFLECNNLREVALNEGIQTIGQIIGLVTYYELKEATTIFDLAVWKA
ncbi:hypothetical protein ACHAXR_000111, partial [Thalassiosira sp. AJA248-18]